MDRSVPEILIYIVIFIGLALFNYLGPRIARWLKDQQQRLGALQQGTQSPLPTMDAGPVAATLPPPRAVTAPIRTKETSAPATLRRRSTVRLHLADRRNLRQAVIMMTVLGPCRSAEPDSRPMSAEDVRAAGGPPGRARK